MIATPTPIIPETPADIGAEPAGSADAVQSHLDAHAANTTSAHGIDALVSTLATKADQSAVDLKAPLASPVLTGTPQAPTAAVADDSTKLATTGFVQAVIRAVINLAPADLDTLKEIADRLQGDETTAAALAATVAGKLAKSANLSDLADPAASRNNLGLGSAATHDASDFDAAGSAAGVSKTSIGLGNVTNDKQLPLAGGTMLGDLDMDLTHVLRFGDDNRFIGYSGDYGGLLLQDPGLFRFQCSASGLGATLDSGNLSVDGQVTAAAITSLGAVSGSVFNGSLPAANLAGTISATHIPTALNTSDLFVDYVQTIGMGYATSGLTITMPAGKFAVIRGVRVLTTAASFTLAQNTRWGIWLDNTGVYHTTSMAYGAGGAPDGADPAGGRYIAIVQTNTTGFDFVQTAYVSVTIPLTFGVGNISNNGRSLQFDDGAGWMLLTGYNGIRVYSFTGNGQTNSYLGLTGLTTSTGTFSGNVSAPTINGASTNSLIPSAGWQAGRVYTCLAVSGTTSSVNKAAGNVEYCPIYLPKGASIIGMYLWISTAAGAGKRARLGIYSNVNGEPGTLLVDAGYVAIDATGTPGVAIAWTVPAAGLYWAAVLYEDVVGLHCFTQLPGLMGAKNIALAGGLACVYANGQTFGPLPSTAPAVSYANSYTPGIYLTT